MWLYRPEFVETINSELCKVADLPAEMGPFVEKVLCLAIWWNVVEQQTARYTYHAEADAEKMCMQFFKSDDTSVADDTDPGFIAEIAEKICSSLDDEIVKHQFRGVTACISDKRLVITKQGYIGLVPSATRPGDKICVLFGGQLPFVLRPKRLAGDSDQQAGRDEEFTLVGPAYICGLENGEAIEMMREGKLESRSFKIR